jgi:hypothetical protein
MYICIHTYTHTYIHTYTHPAAGMFDRDVINLLSGSLAGLTAVALTYPLDLVRYVRMFVCMYVSMFLYEYTWTHCGSIDIPIGSCYVCMYVCVYVYI